MQALSDKEIELALFISPVVDMEKLILDMMSRAGVSEAELHAKGEIPTEFGETLSYKYLSYVREHPVIWNIPTRILYGEKDHLTSQVTISTFANRIGAPVTVLKDGEHWFHTPEEMAFLDCWVREAIL